MHNATKQHLQCVNFTLGSLTHRKLPLDIFRLCNNQSNFPLVLLVVASESGYNYKLLPDYPYPNTLTRLNWNNKKMYVQPDILPNIRKAYTGVPAATVTFSMSGYLGPVHTHKLIQCYQSSRNPTVIGMLPLKNYSSIENIFLYRFFIYSGCF